MTHIEDWSEKNNARAESNASKDKREILFDISIEKEISIKKETSRKENVLRDINNIDDAIDDAFSKGEAFRLNKLLDQRDSLEKDMEMITNKIEKYQRDKEEYIKPFKKIGIGGMAWRNPNIENKYYLCFWNGIGKNNNIEIHKWLAEKYIFNKYLDFFEKLYPKKKFSDFVVHHLDKDIENIQITNLVVIPKEVHGSNLNNDKNKIIHSNIEASNYNSGILELKRLGIKQPHIQELN